MKNITDAQPGTPFEKFKKLTERLLAVPKKELDEKLEEYKQKNTAKTRRKKTKRS